MTQKKLTQLTHSGQKWCWLERLGVADLVAGMQMLSADYDLPWAAQWQQNLDNPGWLDRAIKNTFGRLDEADKKLVRAMYEDWQWCFGELDLAAAVKLGHVAEVALLWGDGRRVKVDGHAQTVLVSLGGASRE